MSKQIKQFREEEYGLFIDLENKPASVALDINSGSLLLNEGDGDDCFDGACLEPSNIHEFEICLGSKIIVQLVYGNNKSHRLGEIIEINKLKQAFDWVKRANDIIGEFNGSRCQMGLADNQLMRIGRAIIESHIPHHSSKQGPLRKGSHSAVFMAEVALLAASGQKTVDDLGVEFGVPPRTINQWKGKLQTEARSIFRRFRKKNNVASRKSIGRASYVRKKYRIK